MVKENITQCEIPEQETLDLGIEVEQSVHGIEMGVLENGTSYLTQTGLADLCGAARATIFDISKEWAESYEDDVIAGNRITFFRDYLNTKNYNDPTLFITVKKSGNTHHAYPDVVCMAFVEYFAFEAQNTNSIALTYFRSIAHRGLRDYIYSALNYQPEDPWMYHHDRISILQNSVPVGYFSVFHETTPMLVDLINLGVTVNHKTVPDISVGKAWAEYWKVENLGYEYGDRKEWKHNYPDYYPQAKSNPQNVYAYPEPALHIFRKWFREEYLTKRYPNYILSKAAVLKGGVKEAEEIASVYKPKTP